ncbi:MAG: Hsp20/alpha crystallin family protein, partial [Candidatus Omnitrophica bacterium]|nr:Hsp20/alpha crystallin family protein [Candidatus Omnitrophota bacterium]
LEETADAYILRSDLPGLDKDKIGVTVRDNIVTLKGVRETSAESQDEKKGFYSQERSYGSFSRSLNLPGPVDESNISATYKNGVLTVTLPKLVGAKNGQKVPVQ